MAGVGHTSTPSGVAKVPKGDVTHEMSYWFGPTCGPFTAGQLDGSVGPDRPAMTVGPEQVIFGLFPLGVRSSKHAGTVGTKDDGVYRLQISSGARPAPEFGVHEPYGTLR